MDTHVTEMSPHSQKSTRMTIDSANQWLSQKKKLVRQQMETRNAKVSRMTREDVAVRGEK